MATWLVEICHDAACTDVFGMVDEEEDEEDEGGEGDTGGCARTKTCPEGTVLIKVALVVVDDDVVNLLLLPWDAGSAEKAEFRVNTTGEPYAFYATVVKSPSKGSARERLSLGPDVILGFASLPLARRGGGGSGADGVVAEVQVALGVGAGQPEVMYTLWVDPVDGLVPACIGIGPLPIIALPLCCGMTVRVAPAWTRGIAAVPRVVAMCAMLRNDVRYAVASETFALPFARPGGRPVPLPNLDEAVTVAFREPATRARTIRRNATIFRELMEAVWHPDRVARGLVDPFSDCD